MRRVGCWLATLILAGCSNDLDLGDGVVRIFTGLEADGWSSPPAIETVDVIREDRDGNREAYQSLDVPEDATTLSFPIRGDISFFEVEGYDADGARQLGGRSFLLDPDGLQGATVPLFAGRVRRFSRPGALDGAPGDHPALGVLGGRFLMTSGQALSSVVALHSYDFGLWYATGTDELTCPTAGDCAVRSMAIVSGSIAVLIGNDWATWTDYSTYYSGELPVPSGLGEFAAVAGGATVDTEDLTAYIVGPTRAEPSDAVLRVADDGALSACTTVVPRAGAGATWIAARGLVIAGGAADGPGVELLADSSRQATTLPFAPDDTIGAALVPIDDSIVMRVGGVDADGQFAPTVVLDLDCTEDCAPRPHSEPIGLADVQAFRLTESILAIGTDEEGNTSGRLIEADGVSTIELRDRRSGARAIQTYLGQVVVAGGTLANGAAADSIEMFIL